MLKVYLFTSIIICGAMTLGGCQKNSSGDDPYLVAPVTDTSDQKFVADGNEALDVDASVKLDKSQAEACAKANGTKNNIDARLSKGATFTKVNMDSGTANSYDASTDHEIIRIYDMTETSFSKDDTYNMVDGAVYATSEKCDIQKLSGSSSGYANFDCKSAGSPVMKFGRGKVRFHPSHSNAQYCYFSPGSAYEPTKSTTEHGQYTLANNKSVAATRTKTTEIGRLMCDGKDVGAATSVKTEVQTYDIPSDVLSACSSSTIYQFEKTLDGNHNHVKSNSAELVDYVQGQ